MPTNVKDLPIDEQRIIKMLRLRSIRDAWLQKTDWIGSLRYKEDLNISLGRMTEAQRKWTPEQMGLYLDWCILYLYLPQTYEANDYALLDPIAYEDIDFFNSNIFPPCPLDTPLSPIKNIDDIEEENTKSIIQ